MKKEPILNPKRDYVTENIFSIIGAFIIWFFKGFNGEFKDEITKKKMLRNVLVVLVLWIILMLIIVYLYFL